MRNKLMMGAVVALTLGGTLAATVSPADAWCRWGRCGWGWGGPVAAGVVAGAVVGSAVAATARPYPYAYGYPYYRAVCPPGYHLGPQGRACWAN